MKITKKQIQFLLLLFLLLMPGCGKTNPAKDDTLRAEENMVKEEEQESATEENGQEEETSQSLPEETTTKDTETDSENKKLDTVVVDGMSRDIISNMNLEEKVGQMFLFGLDTLREDGKTKKTKKLTDSMKEILEKYSPGGVFLYSKNMKDAEQTKQLVKDLKDGVRIPLFVGTEESTGEQAKISSVTGMKVEKKDEIDKKLNSKEPAKIKEGAKQIASYMKDLGFQVNFLSPLEGETEEEELDQMQFADSFLSGTQEGGISAVMYAFPGGTQDEGDTRKGSFDIERTIGELRKSEFKIYEKAVEQKVDFITVGHASYSLITENQIPASLSKLMTTEILRKELRYDGIIITDSMNQKAITDVYTVPEAAIMAVEAGADMLFYPSADGQEAYEAVLSAVKDGSIEESRIEESVMRILRVKISRGLIPEDTELIER